MNPLFNDRTRRIVPRWRDARTTARLGELGSLGSRVRHFAKDSIEQKHLDWTTSPSLFVATDIIGTALLCDERNDPVVQAAAQLVLSDSAATEIARDAAGRIFHRGELKLDSSPVVLSTLEVYQRIGALRRSLHEDLRNAIGWVDLSYLYTLVGEKNKATAAMEMALRLAPDSRHVLRSAARLYVHNDEKPKAAWLLRHAARTRFDPWLIAAEIGVSGLLEQTPRFAKSAALMTAADFDAHDITELAAGLGTLEAEHGNGRKAKRLFQRSLEDPNDNVLAQAAWAARETKVVNIDPTNIDVPFSYEARARINFRQQAFGEALRESESWFNDQRFSVGAAIFASYIAGVVLAQHDDAIVLLQTALVANPGDWTLRNNLAFSLASLDRIEGARKVFAGISSEAENPARHGVWLATSGLLAFRSGDVVEGQRLYDAAIETFDGNKLLAPRALAATFKAREELNARLPTATAAVERAKELAAKSSAPELPTVVAQLEQPSDQLSLIDVETSDRD